MKTRITWEVAPLGSISYSWSEIWQQLNAECCHSHPLLEPAFLGPLLRHFGHADVHLARLDIQGNCTGLALVERLHAGRWALFQPSQAPLGPVMINKQRCPGSDAIQRLIRSLPGHALELDLTFLDPEYSPHPEEGPHAERILQATTMGVTTAEGFEAYWNTRKRQLRSNLRRYHRRLEEAGIQPEFEVISDPVQIEQAVDAYGDLEIKGWKGQEGTAVHQTNRQGQAYRGIMRAFADRGQGIVYQMLIDGKLAASWMIIQSDGMAVMLKTTFDEQLSTYALGRVILYNALQYLFENNDLKVIEFYTNANADQLQWGNISREILHANCYRYPLVLHARKSLRSLLGSTRQTG